MKKQKEKICFFLSFFKKRKKEKKKQVKDKLFQQRRANEQFQKKYLKNDFMTNKRRHKSVMGMKTPRFSARIIARVQKKRGELFSRKQ